MNQSDRVKSLLTHKKVRQRNLIGVIGKSLTEVNAKLNKNPLEEDTLISLASFFKISFEEMVQVVEYQDDSTMKEIENLKEIKELQAQLMESKDKEIYKLKSEISALREELGTYQKKQPKKPE